MLNRRNILWAFGATFVTGCAEGVPSAKRPSPEPVYGNGVVKFDGSASAEPANAEKVVGVAQEIPMRVTDVAVDVSGLEGVKGRQFSIPNSQVQTDLRNTLLATLRTDATRGQTVKVNLLLDRFSLVSPGQSYAIGGVSTIAGTMWVVDAKAGTVVMKPTRVWGTAKGGWALGGLIGAALTKSPDEDYRATLAGFSADVKKRLFGG